MARTFAKKFYNSKQWQGVREYILKRDKYMCKQCGSATDLEVHHIEWLDEGNITNPAISVNEKNLITLCRDCHFKVHEGKRVQAMKKSDVGDEYYFDEHGNLQRTIPPIQIS